MFTIFNRQPKESLANSHGYNDAWLGIGNQNPYPVGSIDHKQYDWGYNEAIQLVEEYDSVPSYYPSNEYGCEGF